MTAVGHVISHYLPRSETFVYTQLRFQRRFRPVVLATHVTNVGEFPHDPIVELVPGRRDARRIRRKLKAFASGHYRYYDRRLALEADRQGCRVLHAHFGGVGRIALPARRRLDLPLVTTFYGRDLAEPSEHYTDLFAEGRAFITEGPTMARRLVDLGCPESRIRLVRIGLDLAEFPFDPPRPTRPLVVLQTCRFVEKKGVDLTIRAFAAARRDLGASELWLVGDGVLRPELEALARRLGVDGSVRFLGMLAGPEYRRVVRRAHIGIQPSRTAADGETEGGAPTVLLEFQAVGLPVVATRHADIPAVVPEPGELAEEEDVDGLAEALVRVASRTPQERRMHAERGRSLVETMHDARIVAGEIEAIYDEALGGAPARPQESDTRLLLEPVGMLSGRSGDDVDNGGLGR